VLIGLGEAPDNNCYQKYRGQKDVYFVEFDSASVQQYLQRFYRPALQDHIQYLEDEFYATREECQVAKAQRDVLEQARRLNLERDAPVGAK